LEWALLEIARRDRRDFYSIPFSGSGQYQVWEAPKPGQPDPEGLLAHLGHFYNGGTEPYGPLVKALELIESGDLRADIFMITDADFAEPPDDFLNRLAQAKNNRPLRIVTVVVGADDAQAQTFADQVICVDDLARDRERLRSAVAAVC